MKSTQFVQFLEVCDIQGGTQPPKSTFIDEPNVGYVRLLQIQDFKTSKKAVYVPDKRTLKKCTSDDIMIARYGASLGKILSGLEGAYNVALVKTIPDLERLDRAYFAHFLRGGAFQSFILNLGGRAAQAGFNKADLERIKIPLPPLEQQKRIAGILDQADALVRLRRRALEKLNTLGQAIFHEMFGDWESENCKWPMATLGEKLTFLTSGSRGWAKHYTDSGAKFIRIQNVQRQGFNEEDMTFVNAPNSAEAKRTKVQPRDVLLSITADLGRAVVVPDTIGAAHINQHLAILRGNEFNPHFLCAAIASDAGQRTIHSRNRAAVKAGLNFDDIRSFQFPFPSIALQAEFEEALVRVNQDKERALRALDVQQSLFASLQHRAFRGEL